MLTSHRIVSVELGRPRAAGHDIVTAVRTQADDGRDTRWTLLAVLKAMNRAERFYTQASNGRRARVQRYTCGQCQGDHIRTHMSDTAIDDIRLLRGAQALDCGPAAPPTRTSPR